MFAHAVRKKVMPKTATPKAAGEGFEPSISGSKDRRVANYTIPQRESGQGDSNPQPCGNLPLIPFIRRLLYQLSYAPKAVNRPKAVIVNSESKC
jgi:hypothetical protein